MSLPSETTLVIELQECIKYLHSKLNKLLSELDDSKSLKDRILEYKEELQKLRMRDGENQNEINKLIHANEKLKTENEAFQFGKLDKILKDNKNLEEKIQNLNDNLHLAKEETIRLKNENKRLYEELIMSSSNLAKRDELEKLCCSISTLQELRFQNESKIKVVSNENNCLKELIKTLNLRNLEMNIEIATLKHEKSKLSSDTRKKELRVKEKDKNYLDLNDILKKEIAIREETETEVYELRRKNNFLQDLVNFNGKVDEKCSHLEKELSNSKSAIQELHTDHTILSKEIQVYNKNKSIRNEIYANEYKKLCPEIKNTCDEEANEIGEKKLENNEEGEVSLGNQVFKAYLSELKTKNATILQKLEYYYKIMDTVKKIIFKNS